MVVFCSTVEKLCIAIQKKENEILYIARQLQKEMGAAKVDSQWLKFEERQGNETQIWVRVIEYDFL